MTTARALSTPAIIGLAALGAALAAVFGFAAFGGFTEQGAGAAARYTARLAFPWFIAAWAASALAALWPGGWRAVLLRRRRAVGLGFAAAHGVHFLMVLAVVLVFGYESGLTTLIGGGATYASIAAMALTSNNWSVRTLGLRNWKTLHTLGALAIAAVFAVSYLGRLEDKPWLAIPALGLLGVVVLLKLAAWVKRRAPRPA